MSVGVMEDCKLRFIILNTRMKKNLKKNDEKKLPLQVQKAGRSSVGVANLAHMQEEHQLVGASTPRLCSYISV